MIDHECGHEIGVAARNAEPAQNQHRLRDIEIDRDLLSEPLRQHHRNVGKFALGRQAAEHLVDELAGGRSVDIADDGDLERVAGEHPPHVIPEIRRRDGRNRLQGAAHRPAIGMAGEGGRPPPPARHLVGARGLPAQPREHLVADALDIDRIEMRGRDRQPQQLEGFILIGAQRAHRARGLVAVDTKAELDRLGFDPLVESSWN